MSPCKDKSFTDKSGRWFPVGMCPNCKAKLLEKRF